MPSADRPTVLFSVGSVAARPRTVYTVRTITDRILRIPNRFWFAIGPRRDQKQLLSHFGKSGTAVFAVEEIEYVGHDLAASWIDLHSTSELSFILRANA
jgi:hypothetical protein